MTNKLYYGDNLDVLRKYIKDESIDLCYIDPPFNSKRNYNQIYTNIGKEDKAQAQAFIDTWEWDDSANKGLLEIQSNYNGAFTTQSIDLINGLENVLKRGSLLAYLVSMTLRIAEIHRVLKQTGSFYLHCDPTASHYLKLVCDAIFCAKGGEFRNEIIWCYSGGARPKQDFARKHDTIFRYAKSGNIIFNADAIRVDYNLDTSKYTSDKAWGSHKGSDKIYAPNPLGKVPEDWWQISPINSQSKERLGYPTQKPESLLERIIKASSNEGDLILDAYCGCGTTVAVAERLNRQWIGIDITYQSISLILKRLEDNFGQDFTQAIADKETKQIIPARLELNGVPKDFASAEALANKKDDKTRKEFEKWLVLTYSNNRAIINEKKGGDGGVDGIAYIPDRDNISDSKTINSKVVLQVKSNKTLSPSVIRDLLGTIQNEKAVCGILLTLYPMPNLIKESKKSGFYHNNFNGNDYPKITVISVAEILAGERVKLPNHLDVLKQAQQFSEQLEIDI